MDTPQKSKVISFWKIYGIIMAVDLVLYFLIFYVGRAIPPASPYTSYAGNYFLCMLWLFAHFPTAFILDATQGDHLLWLSIFQDAWLAGLIYSWRQRKIK